LVTFEQKGGKKKNIKRPGNFTVGGKKYMLMERNTETAKEA